jgi:hypothetical protein
MDSIRDIRDNRVLIGIPLEEGLKRRNELLALSDEARRAVGLGPRRKQIIPEIIGQAVAAFDLLAHGWNLRDSLCIGCAARSLFECRMLAQYVAVSEENAERFYQDGLVDIRDIFDSLHNQAGALAAPPEFTMLISQLKQELAVLMQENRIAEDLKHLSAAGIASAVGRIDEHRMYYQFLSKFSHASAVTVLTRNGTSWNDMTQPILTWIGLFSYLTALATIVDTVRAAPHDKTPPGI